MSTKKEDFIHKLEFYYRNFGNEWSLNEIIPEKQQNEFYLNLLIELEEQKIIKLNHLKQTFKIIDLPSKYS